MIIKKIFFAVLAVGFLLPVVHAQVKNSVLLKQLENYSAPPFPASQHAEMETYDYRASAKMSNPPKPLSFVIDVCGIALRDNPAFKPNLADTDDIQAAISLYEIDWRKIPGFRPWTHSNYVRSLSSSDKATLVKDIVNIFRNGYVTLDDCNKKW